MEFATTSNWWCLLVMYDGQTTNLSHFFHDGLNISGTRLRRIRDVDMKRDFAFVEFSDPRDADDARYSLNGREIDGSRLVVEFARGTPRGPGGSRDRDRGDRDRGDRDRGDRDRGDRDRGDREYLGRGPPPGSGRCFNCGIDGHWARDCKAGDWKNKCYRCGDRGHIERNCKNSPKKLSRRDSRSPSPRRGRSRSRSYSRGRSYSRSRSPVRRDRDVSKSRSPKRAGTSSPAPRREREEMSRSRSPLSPKRGRASSPSPVRRELDEMRRSRSPPVSRSPSKGRKRSLTPGDKSPRERGSPSPRDHRPANGSDHSASPSRRDALEDRIDEEPMEQNGRSHSRSPSPVAAVRGPVDDEYDNRVSPRSSESS
ncbi:hypothetical protein ACFE04_003360 [Oxalis oulophora]